MKRILVSLLSLLLTFSLLMPIVAEDNESITAKITIQNKQEEYDTLFDAVLASENGDTIIIPEGEFAGLRIGYYSTPDESELKVPFKIVSFKGVEGKTIINGGIHFMIKSNSETQFKDISIEGLTFKVSDNISAWYGHGVRIASDAINNNDSGNEAMANGYSLTVKNCKFIDWWSGISVNGNKGIGIDLKISDNEFENNFTAISAQFTNKFGKDTGVTTTSLSNNQFDNVDYQIQPFNMQQVIYEGTDRFYDTIENYEKDTNFENPTYDGLGISNTEWPYAVKDTSNDNHKYYKTLEDALNDETEGEKYLDLREDISSENDFEIGENEIVTINFNGHNIDANIINNGKLKFVDLSIDKTGGLTDESNITNNNEIEIVDNVVDKNKINGDGKIIETSTSHPGPDKPDNNWVYRPSYNDSKDEEVKEYTTEDKTKACIELLGKGWEYSESNKSCVYTLDSNTQQIPNTSTR